MPQRVHFSVVHASSTEKGYNMRELEIHNPQVKGWQSSRFCLYPQEVILNLKEKIRIRQVQILAHEYLTSTKIDLYVGMTAPDHMTKSHHKQYKLLGYTLFRDNVTTAHKVRELKSVDIDAVGQYVRLVLDKNHVNKFNLFNQVGLIAVNVIGDNKFTEDAESEDPRLVNKRVIDEFLLLQSHFKDIDGDPVDPALIEAAASTNYISSTNDLAFDMYQDPEVATLVRKLETKRDEAVRDRLFTLGKRLDKAIEHLKKAGDVLNAYDVEKRRAVEVENYDLARLKKMQMEDYRKKMYKDLELQDLCRHCVIDFWYEKFSWENPVNEYTPSRDLPNRPPSHPFLRDPSLKRDEMPFEPRHLAPFETYFNLDDDRPIPTLASKEPDTDIPSASVSKAAMADAAVDETGSTPSSDSGRGSQASDTVTGEMFEQIRKQSAGAIEIFGQDLVIKIHSRNWTIREEGFKMLTSYLEKIDEGCDQEELRHTLRASVTLSVRGLKDKVYAVFKATLHLLGVMFEHWIPKHKLQAGQSVEIVLPELMARISDTNMRLKTAAINFVVSMATNREVGILKMVPRVCVAPFKINLQSKTALARVDIVLKLVEKLGLDAKNGLTVGNTTAFANRTMEHTQAAVREAAVYLIFELYKLKGSEVIGHLPLQNDPKVSANKSLYWKLFEGLSQLMASEIEVKIPTATPIPDTEISADNQSGPNDTPRMHVEQSNQDDEQFKETEIKEELPTAVAVDDDDDMLTMQHELAKLKIKTAAMREDLGMVDKNEAAIKTTPVAGSPSIPVSRTPKHSSQRRTSLPAPSFVLSNPSRLSTRTPFAPSAAGTVKLGGYAIDNQCVFCAEEDGAFRTQSGMDEHYAKLCPMLMLCHSCNQLVETSGLHDHLLTECPNQEQFAKCPRCHQVKEKTVIEKHKTCPVLQDGMTRCPLCNLVLTQREEHWHMHLMGNYGCKASVRRQLAVKRVGDGASSSKVSIPAKSRVNNFLSAPNSTKQSPSKVSRIPRPVRKLTQSI